MKIESEKTIGVILTWIISYCIGGVDGILLSLLIFISIDFITGIINAIIFKNLSAKKCLQGIFKKIYIIILVMVVNVLEINILGNGGVIRNTIIIYFIANEGISILENAGKVGVMYPKWLTNTFEKFKKTEDENNDS